MAWKAGKMTSENVLRHAFHVDTEQNHSGGGGSGVKQGTHVAMVGAGPYGLSLAAHLRARDVKFRIFGEPMRFWRNMPVGVNLKSLAFATNIALPTPGYSYPEWCRQHGLEDFEPCTMQSFAAYGLEIQKRFVA